MSQYVTIRPSTGLTLMRVNNETWKNVSHIKNENLLIIRGKTLHQEKVMVIFQGLTLKSLDSTSLFLTMDPNLCSLVIIFSTSRMIVLRSVSQKETCPGKKWSEHCPGFWKLFGLNHHNIHYNFNVNDSNLLETYNGGQTDGKESLHIHKNKNDLFKVLQFLCPLLL